MHTSCKHTWSIQRRFHIAAFLDIASMFIRRCLTGINYWNITKEKKVLQINTLTKVTDLKMIKELTNSFLTKLNQSI